MDSMAFQDSMVDLVKEVLRDQEDILDKRWLATCIDAEYVPLHQPGGEPDVLQA